MMVQTSVVAPTPTADATMAFVPISHIPIPPPVLRESRALTQSPLKSCVPVRDATNPHAAPEKLLSPIPPNTAVSHDSAIELAWLAAPTAPVPMSLLPCCVHVAPLLVNSHAAPVFALSVGPPTMAVLPAGV